MPGVRQADPALSCDFRRTGAHLQAQFGPGEDYIQIRHNAEGVLQRFRFGRDPVAELPEDTAFFRIDIDYQLFQFLLHKFKIGSESMPRYQISFTVLQSKDFQDALDEQLKEWSIHLVDMKMSTKENGHVSYDLSLRASYRLDTKEILRFFNSRDDVVTVSVVMP